MLEYFSHYKGKDITSIVSSQTTELKVDLVQWTVEFNWIFLFSKSELSSNLSKKKKKNRLKATPKWHIKFHWVI